MSHSSRPLFSYSFLQKKRRQVNGLRRKRIKILDLTIHRQPLRTPRTIPPQPHKTILVLIFSQYEPIEIWTNDKFLFSFAAITKEKVNASPPRISLSKVKSVRYIVVITVIDPGFIVSKLNSEKGWGINFRIRTWQDHSCIDW